MVTVTTVSGGDKADEYLRALAERLSGGGSVKVGFLEGSTYPESDKHPAGTPVAYVAAIQNYGDPSSGIPPRPFFSNMVRDKSPGWGEDLAGMLALTNDDSGKALALMGEHIAGQLAQSIVDTNSPPLADSTIAKKGHAKPLIDSGDMLKSIRSEVE